MYIVKCENGQRWKVRQAVSLKAALNAIAHARALGSVGSKDTINDTWSEDGEFKISAVTVLADVVQINSDGSERRPYTEAY